MVVSSHELKPKHLDLVRELEENLLAFYGTMKEKKIQPEIKLPENPVYRELDPDAVSRIFSNIISNALKYSSGDLSVIMDRTGCITFSNTAQNLDSVAAEKLFNRFYTVNASRNSTGLGLSIAKALTEQMNGSIQAHYESGRLHIILKF